MRNNKRVRFFRRLIYIVLALLLFLPLILTSFLSIRLISRIEKVEQRLGELELRPAAVPAASLPLEALPLEEKEPAIDDGQTTDLSDSEATDDPVPEEDGDPQVPLGFDPEDEANAPPSAPATSSVLQPAPLTGR
jgi:hypothetical protein